MSIFELAVIIIVMCYIITLIIVVLKENKRKLLKQRRITCNVCGETFDVNELLRTNNDYVCPRCKHVITKEELSKILSFKQTLNSRNED